MRHDRNTSLLTATLLLLQILVAVRSHIDSTHDCVNSIIYADEDNNKGLGYDEFLVFYNEIANYRCAEYKYEMDMELEAVFHAHAYICHGSCLGKNATIYYNIDNSTTDEEASFSTLCTIVQEIIGPDLCPHHAPDASTDGRGTHCQDHKHCYPFQPEVTEEEENAHENQQQEEQQNFQYQEQQEDQQQDQQLIQPHEQNQQGREEQTQQQEVEQQIQQEGEEQEEEEGEEQQVQQEEGEEQQVQQEGEEQQVQQEGEEQQVQQEGEEQQVQQEGEEQQVQQEEGEEQQIQQEEGEEQQIQQQEGEEQQILQQEGEEQPDSQQRNEQQQIQIPEAESQQQNPMDQVDDDQPQQLRRRRIIIAVAVLVPILSLLFLAYLYRLSARRKATNYATIESSQGAAVNDVESP